MSQGTFTASQVSSLLKGWFLAIFIPSLCFWLLHLSSGEGYSPDFKTWPSPQQEIALVLQFGCCGLLFGWVFFSSGAVQLANVFRLVSNFPDSWLNPYTMKFIALLTVASGVASFYL
ncbi:MAG: hypothetical protein R3E50_12700 [Halioglobus sp.]